MYVRGNEQIFKLFKQLDLSNKDQTAIVSVVSVGEIESIAIRNRWGSKRLEILNNLLSSFYTARINAAPIIKKYAEIDAYSQNKLPNKPLNNSSRNMGKNDLWIAATASVLDAKLITTDKDFSHLQNEYLDIEFVEI